MTYKDFIIVMQVASDPDKVMANAKALPKPKRLCGKDVPENLNLITIGKLIELQACTADDILVKAACILLDVKENQVLHEQAESVLAFDIFVSNEIARIGKLFESVSIPLTDLQRKAGYDKLNFGPFAILDNFALRMGITNHEEAENVPWIRIYKCMQIDNERELCRRRAEEIQLQEMKTRR